MKLSSKIAALAKKRIEKKQAEPKRGHPNGGTVFRLRWECLALGLIVLGGGTLAVFEFALWKLPPELAGRWRVAEGAPGGSHTGVWESGLGQSWGHLQRLPGAVAK